MEEKTGIEQNTNKAPEENTGCAWIFAIGIVLLSILIGMCMNSCGHSSKRYRNTVSTTHVNRCEYEYSDGTTCGATCSGNRTLCDYHYNQLKDTYDYVIDRYNSVTAKEP